MVAGMVKEEAAADWVDDGSLPLDGDGLLPFYFLDAHEEPSQPGVVHLFGKVKIHSASQDEGSDQG